MLTGVAVADIWDGAAAQISAGAVPVFAILAAVLVIFIVSMVVWAIISNTKK